MRVKIVLALCRKEISPRNHVRRHASIALQIVEQVTLVGYSNIFQKESKPSRPPRQSHICGAKLVPRLES